MLTRLQSYSSWAFLRFMLCAVVSLSILCNASIVSKAATEQGIVDNEYKRVGDYVVNDVDYTIQTYTVTIPVGSLNANVDGSFDFDDDVIINQGDRYYNFDIWVDEGSIGVDGISEGTGDMIYFSDLTGDIEYDVDGSVSYVFTGACTFYKRVALPDSVKKSDYATVCIDGLYQRCTIRNLNGTVISKEYIDVGDGNMYRIHSGYNQIETNSIRDNMTIITDVEFSVVVPSSTADTVTFIITRPAVTDYYLAVYAYDEYYTVSGFEALLDGAQSIKPDIVEGNELQEKNNELQEEQNTLQEKQNELQETANQLQEEANETQKGILGQITDFFGSFFENIINAVKSLFIPEDGYFSDFFTRLNDFFSEKLGVLYAPIDIFIDILTGITNANGVDPGLSFPGISWEGIWIIEPQTISLSTYADAFPGLHEKVYFVTNIMLVGWVLSLLQHKLREVMTN